MARNKKTKDTDKGYRRILKDLGASDRSQVTVGFHAKDVQRDNSDLNVAEIAAIHEFGSEDGVIPERSFIRSTVDDNSQKYRKFVVESFLLMIRGKLSPITALDRIGIRIRDDVKRKIVTLREPANTIETIVAKGSANPLIDSGTMLSRVKHASRIK